jgi:DNA-binding transcriptional MerR regulator
MLIGELSARSGVSQRSLRHYEKTGLLTARREDNGYRTYDEGAVARASAIQALFGMGFARDTVRTVLSCAGEVAPEVHADVAAALAPVRDELSARIAELTATRDALDDFLARHRAAAAA